MNKKKLRYGYNVFEYYPDTHLSDVNYSIHFDIHL